REVLAQRLGLPADLLERDRAAQVAHVADVHQVPARLFARGLGVVVLGLALELGRVRIGQAGDLADAVDARDLAVRVVEEHAVARRHLAHEVACLVVAHAGPGLAADALQVVDREVARFGLHQPMAFTLAHSRVPMKVACSVQAASSGTSQGARSIASTCCNAKPTPTSHGGGEPPGAFRNANVRSYQPPPMPSRWQLASNATRGSTASPSSLAS